MGEPIVIDATASSGLPVGYRAQPRHRCAIETAAAGTLLRLEAEGTCSVTASQPGDATWAPAPDVEATIEIAAPEVAMPPVVPPGQANDVPPGRANDVPPGQAMAEPPGQAKAEPPAGPEPGGDIVKPGKREKHETPGREEPPGNADSSRRVDKPGKPTTPQPPGHVKAEPPDQASDNAANHPAEHGRDASRGGPTRPARPNSGGGPSPRRTGRPASGDQEQGDSPNANDPAQEPGEQRTLPFAASDDPSAPKSPPRRRRTSEPSRRWRSSQPPARRSPSPHRGRPTSSKATAELARCLSWSSCRPSPAMP